MKLLSDSKQPSENSKNHKKIQKAKQKLLKYKPKQGDQSKQWQIEAIVNERMMIIPEKSNNQKILNQMNFQDGVIRQQLIKQYEISWKQKCDKGLWANTWQPQQNIPDFTRLDYLQRKKNEQRNFNKTKKQTSTAKTKQSLQKHIQFTMNKMSMKPFPLSKTERRQTIKKIINKNQKDKSPQKQQKSQNYRSWFISYSSKTEEFQKLIYRFLKKEKNEQSQTKQSLSNNKSNKYSVTKQEFLSSLPQKKQPDISKIQENLLIPKIKQETISQHKEHYMPKDASDKFIKDVFYCLNLNQVDYFKLVLFDNSVAYISEEDLIKYFPFAYQQALIKKIGQSIEQAQNSLSKFHFNEEKNEFSKYFDNLGEKIGVQKQDFEAFDLSQGFSDRRINNSNFSQMACIFGNREFRIEDQEKTAKQMMISKKILYSGQKENEKKLIQNQIQMYFSYIKESAQQLEIIQHEPYDGNGCLYKKPKYLQFQYSTQCKQLFRNSFDDKKNFQNQVNQKKKQMAKIQEKTQKNEEATKKQRNSLKIERHIPTFQNNIKLESLQSTTQQKKKGKQQKVKEVIQISQESIREKSMEKVHSKLMSQENQIKQILSVLYKPEKQCDNFYDSDDQESNK